MVVAGSVQRKEHGRRRDASVAIGDHGPVSASMPPSARIATIALRSISTCRPALTSDFAGILTAPGMCPPRLPRTTSPLYWHAVARVDDQRLAPSADRAEHLIGFDPQFRPRSEG